jgi:hypothetical protein
LHKKKPFTATWTFFRIRIDEKDEDDENEENNRKEQIHKKKPTFVDVP